MGVKSWARQEWSVTDSVGALEARAVAPRCGSAYAVAPTPVAREPSSGYRQAVLIPERRDL